MSRPYDLTYGFTSDTHGHVNWRWDVEDKEKIFHHTWKPKQANVKILDAGFTPEQCKAIALEIIINIQSELKRL